MSLTCALLATFLQQWARRYLKVTHSRYSPDKRARIRAFCAEGVENCLLPWVVETLPTLLHISLFLFFAGLVVFLCNVNITIFKLVLSWVGLCTALYGCIILMPIFRHDSPYYTSLSSLVWYSATGMAGLVSVVSWLLSYLVCCGHGAEWLLYFADRCLHHVSQGMQKTVEEAALDSPSEIINRAFMWTFDSLDEDHELERFFSGLPGFRSSKVVADPLPRLTDYETRKLFGTLIKLLDRTLSSDLLPAPIKNQRAMVCMKAINSAYSPYKRVGPYSLGRLKSPLDEILVILRGWGAELDLPAQAIISTILARVQPCDDSWFLRASGEMGGPEAVLRDYAAHGHSLSLFILIHLVHQHFNHLGTQGWPDYFFSSVLEAASKFDVKDTSPQLQRDFCALWNQIVRKAQDGNNRRIANDILARIRNVYLALHQDTNSAPTRFSPSTSDRDAILSDPASYPVCNNRDSHLDSAPHIYGGSTSPNPVTALAIHGSIDASPKTTQLSTPDHLVSPPPSKPKASTSSRGVVATDHTAFTHTTAGDLSVPSSASPAPVLPTGLLLPSDSPMTGSDLLRRC